MAIGIQSPQQAYSSRVKANEDMFACRQ